MKSLLLLLTTLILSGCYVHYPSVGVANKYRVRPTDWQGRRCVVIMDQDKGSKHYICGPDRYRRQK